MNSCYASQEELKCHLFSQYCICQMAQNTVSKQNNLFPEYLAERQGFEPWVRLPADNGFRDRPIRPLWHLSIKKVFQKKHLLCSSSERRERAVNPPRKPAIYQCFIHSAKS